MILTWQDAFWGEAKSEDGEFGEPEVALGEVDLEVVSSQPLE